MPVDDVDDITTTVAGRLGWADRKLHLVIEGVGDIRDSSKGQVPIARKNLTHITLRAAEQNRKSCTGHALPQQSLRKFSRNIREELLLPE